MGRGPNVFTHTALDHVLHGGETNKAENLPADTCSMSSCWKSWSTNRGSEDVSKPCCAQQARASNQRCRLYAQPQQTDRERKTVGGSQAHLPDRHCGPSFCHHTTAPGPQVDSAREEEALPGTHSDQIVIGPLPAEHPWPSHLLCLPEDLKKGLFPKQPRQTRTKPQ